MLSEANITSVSARAYTIPTDAPEGDGTFTWDKTTLVLVEVEGGGKSGVGFTYADASVAAFIDRTLGKSLHGKAALDVSGCWMAMQRAVRNLGRSGLAACAIAAVDVALWDLKAKLLDVSVALMLGRARDAVPIYGSGGFTTYSDKQLHDQLSGWVERDGCRAVKMKVGAEPEKDLARVAVAKAAIGEAALFVDANGAFAPRQAIEFGRAFADRADIRWFEEPVSSDDLAGLRLVREAALPAVDIAAGEYLYTLDDRTPHARRRSGGRAAGGCDALWRHYRIPGDRGTVRGRSPRSLRPLRAGTASPSRLRDSAVSSSGMVS